MFILRLPIRMLEYLKIATLYPIIFHIHLPFRLYRPESAMHEFKALKIYSGQTSLRNKFRYLNLAADGFACVAVFICYVDLSYLMKLF